MAFYARRSLASGLSRHLTRRPHPSLPHLVLSHHDRSENPSCASSTPTPPARQPSPFPFSDLRRRSRPQNLTLPLPFAAHLAAHRNFSSEAEVDAAGGIISDAASSVGPAFPASFPGEVAAAAADSFPPVAAVQYLIDAVHSFTGLNWWASIALAMVLVRTAMIPLAVLHFRSNAKYNALKPEIQAIDKDILNLTDTRLKEAKKKKLSELFKKHGVSRLTPFQLPFVLGPIILSFNYAIRNMIEKVPSLKVGGAFWFTDLTTPDELYILPMFISMAYAADELDIKARLAGSPMQQRVTNLNRVMAILMMPLAMCFCKAHVFYWLPFILFSHGNAFAFRIPAIRQYLDIPLIEPQSVLAAQEPTSEVPKPIPAVDSPPAVSVSAQSSSESSDTSVDSGKKRRTPRVITNREQ